MRGYKRILKKKGRKNKEGRTKREKGTRNKKVRGRGKMRL